MTSDASGSQPELTCDDAITRYFAAATIFWGLIASLAGLFSGTMMLVPELRDSLSNGDMLTYGRVRPIFTTLAIYGFVACAAFTVIYHTTQRLCKRRMWSDALGRFHFVLWQLMILLSVATLLQGRTQGQGFTEPEWQVDVGFALAWILFFGVNFLMTIAKRREKQLYISLWFYIATVVIFGAYQIAHALITNVTEVRSDTLLSGASDALIHSVLSHNTITLLLVMPFMGLIYYFAPKISGRPIYSYKLAVAQFWGVVVFFCWVGPSQLHLTAIPDYASSLAMIFGLMLWMPVWGAVVNGLKTIQVGAGDDEKIHSATDLLGLKLLAMGIVFLALTSFCLSLSCIKSVSAVLNYTDWVNAQWDASVWGSCGLMTLGVIYWLTPRLLGGREISDGQANAHFWLAIAGVLLITIPGYAAGLWQGLSLGSLTPDTGQLVELEFLRTVEQVAMLRWLRLLGFAVFAVGMLLMGLNVGIAMVLAVKVADATLGDTANNEPTVQRPASKYADAPMLDLAKNFDVWKNLHWHRLWERDASKFVWVPLIVACLATLIQVVPAALVSGEKIAQPYTPLELVGRDLFRAEGCTNCHTKIVRPLVAETKRFGELSQAGEFAYDHPSQWGFRRVGPDLAREGGKQTSHWHWVHLQDPRDADWCDPRSVMPSFKHLATRELDPAVLKSAFQSELNRGTEYPYPVADAAEVARLQAEQIAAEVVTGGGPIWTVRHERNPVMVYDSQAIALVAYLQRLGTDLYRPASSKSPANSPSDEDVTQND